ncbi:family 43 glycosylhydrolase [Hymenobacter sediminicola]|uniref:Family 43 glycosylhydrolase n=1 Tax=Hymenobacter sediminicola TaxID=2761579 RepID=A0A7G7W6T4_9BACT|nr:family 43 glycosylhydrolase [Hymenobacter sediminicola]QNH62077.1 family 43 glycosylhydrolase [Hymenobacter sediminicola]
MSFELESGTLVPTPAVPLLVDRPQPFLSGTATTAPVAPARISYDHLVLPGDFPDPTIAKIGDTYWASATSAEWGAVFPLFKSTDLLHWELVSHVFPGRLPEWCDSNFWAPEIFWEGGKVYLYYTARRRGSMLCVAVASADNPEGPYTDHGPLVGEEAGSIDGFPIHDEHGVLHLVWKNDGNSRGESTPLWAQELDEQRLELVGPRHELFRNDAPWEGPLVEGSAMVRHNGYFYMFYAGNSCCGKYCTYAEGVARSRTLLGPWEKCPQNPILTDNSTWKCPGHGTVAEKDGRWFLLHHAYHANSHEFVGRQGLLSEFTWNAEGWPEFVNNSPQAAPLADVRVMNVTDNFEGDALSLAWQWPIGNLPRLEIADNELRLGANTARLGAVVAQRTYAATYATSVLLDTTTLPQGTFAGLGAIGDPYNALALVAGDNMLQLWLVRMGKKQRLLEVIFDEPCATLGLRLECWGGSRFRFSYSLNQGNLWQPLRADEYAINGTYLPPWDRGVRVGLIAQGKETATVTFRRFSLRNLR